MSSTIRMAVKIFPEGKVNYEKHLLDSFNHPLFKEIGEKEVKAVIFAIVKDIADLENKMSPKEALEEISEIEEMLKRDLTWENEDHHEELVEISILFGNLYEYKLGNSKENIIDGYNNAEPRTNEQKAKLPITPEGEVEFSNLQKMVFQKCKEEVFAFCKKTYGSERSSPSVEGSSGELADRSGSTSPEENKIEYSAVKEDVGTAFAPWPLVAGTRGVKRRGEDEKIEDEKITGGKRFCAERLAGDEKSRNEELG